MGARDGRARTGGELNAALDTTVLASGWELAGVAPGGEPDEWIPAVVPGTVAGALEAAGIPPEALDERDWWFRARVSLPEPAVGEALSLRIGGVATIAEVRIDGIEVSGGESMFDSYEIPVDGGRTAELSICCRALAPRLAERRRPRARWRTRLVEHPNLRFVRTMLLGRTPGFAPGPPVVGPWRPVELLRRRVAVTEEVRLRARCEGTDGVVTLQARLRPLNDGRPVSATLICRDRGRNREWTLALPSDSDGCVDGELRVDGAERWWPHTHGEPALHEVSLRLEAGGELVEHPLGRIGFRELRAGADLPGRGLDIHVNGVPVFARGAVWVPLDLRSPHTTAAAARPVLERVVEAGMNLLRVPGTAAYESDAFLDLCDELGIMLWQDFMFANLDYPESDSEFMAVVESEARRELGRVGHRPALAAVCGGSEVAQQVAMVGLDPALADGPLYGGLLPRLVDEAGIDAPYVPSAPCGGELPFRPRSGIANYYGVGAYLRPLSDARLSEVRFAAECLAFANVPDGPALPGAGEPGGAAWKRGVPRDTGAGWDFDDVRDHYLRERHGVDPAGLRYSEPERYVELSRAVSGEMMAAVFGEWRREQSVCSGGLVLWLKDLAPGPGWGVLDHRGEPKVAFHHLRRALAPVAVWLVDEGLNGIDVHVANDGPQPLAARLRVALYRDGATLVEERVEDIELPAHGGLRVGVEQLLGHFVDPNWSYRFGPRAVDLIVASLEHGEQLIAQTLLRAGRDPLLPAPAEALGLSGRLTDGALELESHSAVYGLRIHPSGLAAEDAFDLEPHHVRRIPARGSLAGSQITLTALNLRGRVALR